MTTEATRPRSDFESPDAPAPTAWFADAARWVVRVSAALGVLRAIQVVSVGSAGADLAALVAEAAYQAGAHAVAGLLLATPVRALGVWLEGRGPGAFSATALQDIPQAMPAVPEPASVRPAAAARIEEARRLIREGEWEAAGELVRDLVAEHPDDPRGPALLDELGRARTAAAERWRGQLAAAREVNDPARVLELYEESPAALGEPDRRELDADLAGWFLSIVHRRLRSGLLQVEVVTLVERVSETFGHTKEGASLRAALPTLRRGAGLCARCGKPYAGLADACPECLGAPEPPPPVIPGLQPVADDELEALADGPTDDEEASWFLEPDEEADGRDAGGPNGRHRP